MTQRLKLDLGAGRALGYELLGAPRGPFVVVLDGPRSPGLARALAPAAATAGIRLAGVLRAPGTTFTQWPADHAALLHQLEVDRAGVVGQSGGTPFALSAAAALGDRVSALSLLGAFWAPWKRANRAGLSRDMKLSMAFGRRAPWLLRRVMTSVASDPAKAAARALAQAPQLDREALQDPALLAVHEQATAEILAEPAELAAEIAQLARPWGVDVSAIRCPVALWSGELDTSHPTVMSQRLAAQIADATVSVVPGAGTFGLLSIYPRALAFAAAVSG